MSLNRISFWIDLTSRLQLNSIQKKKKKYNKLKMNKLKKTNPIEINEG